MTHLQLVGRVVEERVEGVPLLLQAQIVVLRRELLRDDAVLQPALHFGHDHHVHDHVFRQPNRGPEVPANVENMIIFRTSIMNLYALEITMIDQARPSN